jgi:hypothetical protein
MTLIYSTLKLKQNAPNFIFIRVEYMRMQYFFSNIYIYIYTMICLVYIMFHRNDIDREGHYGT